jgi:outer membrane autotransporter protein
MRYGIAVKEFTQSGNVFTNYEMVGSLTGSTAFGLRFSGTNSAASNGNIVENYGAIISGTGIGGGTIGSAGIYFNAANHGQSNGNIVVNYGTIIGLDANHPLYFAGILFSCIGNGDTKYNLVKNEGSILVSGSIGTGLGIGFISESAQSANNNTIINDGLINVNFVPGAATGISLNGQSGDASENVVINRGRIEAFASTGQATGIELNGAFSGICSNNVITNYGSIFASGSAATGIFITGTLGVADSNVINNWGAINANNGAGIAINIVNGSNNVINLNGHSSVQGLIAASGSNNVLNIAFTGISAKKAKALRAQLGTALNGSESSGSFTVRGVTYTYDPLIVNLDVSSYEEQAKTPNQKAIGANLDSFKVNPTGDMLQLLNALDSGNVPAGLEQLSPQRYQIYGDIALANANLLTQGIDQRLNNVRVGSEGFDTSALGVSCSKIQSKLGMGNSKASQASATMSKDGKSVTLKDAVTETNRWGAFLSGEITFAGIDGQNRQQDSNFVSSGLLAGVDAKITDAFTGGLLLSYAHTDADMDSQNSTANVDTYGTGVYGGYRQGNFYGNGLASFSRNIYESDRNIGFSDYSKTANGRTSGNQYVFNIDGGYDHPVCKDLTVGPFVGLQYVHLGVNSFTENGADGADLAINEQAMDSIRSRLGLRLELRKELTAQWTVASEVRLAWQHEFANNDRAIVARFSDSGLGSFAVRTNDPERNAALVGLGLNATYRETLTTFVDYDVQADPNYTEQIVKGGFKWNF